MLSMRAFILSMSRASSSVCAADRAAFWRRVSRSTLASFCSSTCSSANLQFLRALQAEPQTSFGDSRSR